MHYAENVEFRFSRLRRHLNPSEVIKVGKIRSRAEAIKIIKKFNSNPRLVQDGSYVLYVSVNSNWVHPPRQPPGLAQKLPGGQDLPLLKVAQGPAIRQGRGFVKIQSETFCPCIGFINDKYRVSQELLKNGENYIVDFQFKLRQKQYKCVLRRRFVFPVF